MRASVRYLFQLLLLGIAAIPAAAQSCVPQWLAGDGIPGLSGPTNFPPAFAMCLWHGPSHSSTPQLIAAGAFETAGSVSALNIASWDGNRWSPLNLGLDGRVHALVEMPNGDLIAGGEFFHADNVETWRIARWDGHAWSTVGLNLGKLFDDGVINALTVLPNGDLVAAGRILESNFVNVARWTGSQWLPMGNTLQGGVTALAVAPDGTLYAGGPFDGGLAKWTGSTWSIVGGGLAKPGGTVIVSSMAFGHDGSVYVGGDFLTAGGVQSQNFARFDGSSWSAQNTGANGPVQFLQFLKDGSLLACGGFTSIGGSSVSGVARWDGSSWSAFSADLPPSGIYCAVLDADEHLFVGGSFRSAGDLGCLNVAELVGERWTSLGTGMDGSVHALVQAPDHSIIMGGTFTRAGGLAVPGIVRWNGRSMVPMVSSSTSRAGYIPVTALVYDQHGALYVGGTFTSFDGQPLYSLAKLDGGAWSDVGHAFTAQNQGGINAILPLPNGDVIVGGNFAQIGGVTATCLARWDGSHWTAMPKFFGDDPTVNDLALLPNGNVVVAGYFNAISKNIVIWNGSKFAKMGAGLNGAVHHVAVTTDGILYAAGEFTESGPIETTSVAKWDGANWSASGATGFAGYCLSAMPHGGLLLDGRIVWNGVNWQTLSPVPTSGIDYPEIYSQVVLPQGDWYVGGVFQHFGNTSSAYWAHWSNHPTPHFIDQPATQQPAEPRTLEISATIETGYPNVHYQWLRNGEPVSDGAEGASTGGGVVSGSSGQYNPSTADPITLTILFPQPSDDGSYTLVVSNDCDSASSNPLALTVCLADFNGDGVVDEHDRSDFLALFEDADAPGHGLADYDGDGFVDFFDYYLFVESFIQGCSASGNMHHTLQAQPPARRIR